MLGHHSRKDKDCTHWGSWRPVIDLELAQGPLTWFWPSILWAAQLSSTQMLINPTGGLVGDLQLPHQALEYCQLPVSCSTKLAASRVSSRYLLAAPNSNLDMISSRNLIWLKNVVGLTATNSFLLAAGQRGLAASWLVVKTLKTIQFPMVTLWWCI